jgi:predicted RNA binding protein YcfA (HicA-like mRNA interferase family)
MVEHPDINGRRTSFPVPYHKGRDLKKGLLSGLIRRFNLPRDIFS